MFNNLAVTSFAKPCFKLDRTLLRVFELSNNITMSTPHSHLKPYLTISSVHSHVSGNSLRTLTVFCLVTCFVFLTTVGPSRLCCAEKLGINPPPPAVNPLKRTETEINHWHFPWKTISSFTFNKAKLMNYDGTEVHFTSEALKTEEQNPMKLLCISKNKALRFP